MVPVSALYLPRRSQLADVHPPPPTATPPTAHISGRAARNAAVARRPTPLRPKCVGVVGLMASLPTASQYRLLINSVLLTMPAALGHLARRPTPSTYSVTRAISHLPHHRARKDIAALQPEEWRGAAQQAALKKARIPHSQ
ncbi:unnamed protein product [Miscanthus lutarioriparius]|uniref:Uncharacterized protein n=1 Tax=Miscanthus lutarioriparius TaxID=422564 RepID=A0A811QYN5_9POAL|nr:unnamed protein product [Miscanthus lutarioriparius]